MAVRKRPDRDSWMVDVVVNGTRIRETRRTKKEALAREKELIAQDVTGTFSQNRPLELRFRDLAAQYLEYAEVNKAEKTYREDMWRINAHFLPFFGSYKLAAINSQLVERYKAKRLRDGVSNRTVNIELQLLSVMFTLAVKREYLRANPMAHVERLREPKKPRRFLSQDEVRRLLDAATTSYLYPLVLCAVHTGMRPQELYHLRWDDLDFDANTITVQSKEDWETKTGDFRVIDMTPRLRETLRSLYSLSESDYVFTYKGRRIEYGVRKAFGRIVRKAGIDNCTLYTLRHTFASHLAMSGVPLMHIQQLLGHTDYNTTLVYAHLSTESRTGHVHRLPFADSEESE